MFKFKKILYISCVVLPLLQASGFAVLPDEGVVCDTTFHSFQVKRWNGGEATVLLPTLMENAIEVFDERELWRWEPLKINTFCEGLRDVIYGLLQLTVVEDDVGRASLQNEFGASHLGFKSLSPGEVKALYTCSRDFFEKVGGVFFDSRFTDYVTVRNAGAIFRGDMSFLWQFFLKHGFEKEADWFFALNAGSFVTRQFSRGGDPVMSGVEQDLLGAREMGLTGNRKDAQQYLKFILSIDSQLETMKWVRAENERNGFNASYLKLFLKNATASILITLLDADLLDEANEVARLWKEKVGFASDPHPGMLCCLLEFFTKRTFLSPASRERTFAFITQELIPLLGRDDKVVDKILYFKDSLIPFVGHNCWAEALTAALGEAGYQDFLEEAHARDKARNLGELRSYWSRRDRPGYQSRVENARRWLMENGYFADIQRVIPEAVVAPEDRRPVETARPRRDFIEERTRAQEEHRQGIGRAMEVHNYASPFLPDLVEFFKSRPNKDPSASSTISVPFEHLL